MNDLVPIQDYHPFIPGEVTKVGLTLPEDLDFEDWEAVGKQLLFMSSACLWWVGDWWAFGEHHYGERTSQFTGPDGEWTFALAFQTCMNAGSVSRAIETSRRREALPWSFHAEVAAQDLGVQDQLLTWCEEPLAAEGGQHRSIRELRQKVRQHKHGHRLEAAQAFAGTETYNVIYADPPWKYSADDLHGSADHHYLTMSIEEICGFLVENEIKVADDAVLFLWVTNPFLEKALEVVKSWCFQYKTHLAWVKTETRRPGAGHYIRGRHEMLWICTRGSFTPSVDPSPPIGSVIEAPIEEHSKKPERGYEVIEILYPGCNYLELFARALRDGWQSLGNELGSTAV